MKERGEIITSRQLLKIKGGENHVPLVDATNVVPDVVFLYDKPDMVPYTGSHIFLRSDIAEKISAANIELRRSFGLGLKIVYGYRHPDIQKKYFEQRRQEVSRQNPGLPGEKIDFLTHEFVALPSVAGHPTGGAIDVTLIDPSGKEIDMGTKIADYRNPEKVKTFAKNITPEQMKERLILHDALLQTGFAPFYGEWWHFSYGDKEWACFYDHKTSLYSPVNYKLE